MFPSLGLPAAFFLSGAAGLIFQIVWLYRCGLALGSSVAALTVVLSAFMAGLAGGNGLAAVFGGRIRNPLRAYAGLEVVVAVSGAIVTALLPRTASLVTAFVPLTGDSGTAINTVRFAIAFVLLVVPTAAMGGTLPLLVAALHGRGQRFGTALGRLYGWNTLGAVAGVVLAETVLVALVGVSGSAWIAAALNLCAAAIAMATAPQGVREDPTTTHDAGPRPSSSLPLLVATALCGMLLLALEVVWFRFLSMYVLVTTLAASLMLAVVLAGIGLGGLLASVWLRRDARTAPALPIVACLAAFGLVGSYAVFQIATTGTQVGEWTRVLWFTIVLTLPVSLLSGVLFTLIGDAVHGRGRSPAVTAGWLTLANTTGALCGPPLAAYLLLPRAGMERSLFVLALGYGVVALCTGLAASPSPSASADASRWTRAGRSSGIVAAAALMLALAAFPFGAMNSRYFLRAASAYADDGSEIVATREGPSETLFVMQQRWLSKPVYSRLVTNGFSMSGTAVQGQRYMRAFAYYPMFFHDGPLKRALVVCYGVGVTVGAVTHIPSIETIDVAEISRDIVAMSDAIYDRSTAPLNDPRVRLHVEDGRFLLQTTTARYDLITGEPPPPRTPGAVNIYTREYFQLVHDRLTDGGLATYWVPVARPHPGTDVNTIVRAFCDVFTDCSLWNATPFDLMLVGSRGLAGPRTPQQFSAPWQTPGLEARLREVGFERPEQIGATFVGDSAYLRELVRDTPPLIDDFPQRLRPSPDRPSLSDPRYGVEPSVTRMYDSTLDVARARAAFSASPFIRSIWPAPLIEASLPYFDLQAIVNRVYWEGGHPLRQIDALDRVLSTTTLRTLPLWILGSDEVKQRIAESSSDASGAVEYARALRALSGRDFGGAAQLLTAARARGLQNPNLDPLLAYALVKGGQTDRASQLLAEARPADAESRAFWEWIRASIRRE